MPIGNLTSQIFANVYLNEFDRFVRHSIKPNAYIRYGDDFVVFTKNKSDIERHRLACIKFLQDELGLAIHDKNDIILPARKKLHFLGHYIYPNQQIHVDKYMQKRVQKRLSLKNISNYKSYHLTPTQRKQLSWQILSDLE